MNRRADRIPHSAVRLRNLAAACLALGAALALSACSSSDGDSKASTKTSAPASSPAASTSVDPDATEKVAVLKTYANMWAEQMKAYKKADATGTDLTKYASLDALAKFRLDLAHMKQAGTVGGGEVGHTPKVSSIDLTTKLPKATVTDCIDLTNWKAKQVKTGQVLPLPTNQPKRYIATAKAQRWKGGWMIVDYTPDGERTC
ncbi:hypothetical protein ACFV2N_18055 [Streptomyces sp. NPDC059680]|uniref:hypothetical protein n=1 Tax=Streptomyces sp. NPDC059680 TaxID=3346904 RepID=UPI00368DC1C1